MPNPRILRGARCRALAAVVLAVAMLASFVAMPLAGQASNQPRPGGLPGFSDVIDVRVVNLEVVVTDRDGNRVEGLEASDFVLRVDGEIVPIGYFSEIRDGDVRTSDRTAESTASAEALPAVPSAEPGKKLRTNYLVFVDDFFSLARDRDRVLDRIEEDLSLAGPDDRFAVVAFDGKRLDLLTSWTGDRAQLRQALADARRRKTHGLERRAELRTNELQRRERVTMRRALDERIAEQGGEAPERAFFETRLDGVELEYANRLTEQVKRSTLAAASALRSFAGPSGRKVMLLLSGGWPFSPSEYTVNDYISTVDETISGAVDEQLGGRDPLFRPLVDTANLLGYTLYPVDVPGLDRETGIDAAEDYTQFERRGPLAGAGGTSLPREGIIHDGLYHLASETGGVALINAERDRSLGEVIADVRSFYWLGFSPKRLENDAAHDISVEVKGRPDLRVRAREGYVDLSRGTEVTMMVESALLFGDPPSTKPLLLEFGRARRAGLGRMTVPLEVGISMDEITLVPNQGRYQNVLEIRVTVMDEQGNRSQTNLDTIEISGDRPAKPGQLYYYETDLQLRKKEHRIVVAVYDPLSGAILSSSSEISGL
jgi:VWFA-related protein